MNQAERRISDGTSRASKPRVWDLDLGIWVLGVVTAVGIAAASSVAAQTGQPWDTNTIVNEAHKL